jgi:hypothetical protein
MFPSRSVAGETGVISPLQKKPCTPTDAGSRAGEAKRLMRQRGELIERSFAHCYETGGMRRTHLQGHPNILKRLLIHVAGFNLGLVMRKRFGIGKPRVLQGLLSSLLRLLFAVQEHTAAFHTTASRSDSDLSTRGGGATYLFVIHHSVADCIGRPPRLAFTTGC